MTAAIKVAVLVAVLFATASARAQEIDFTDHYWQIDSTSLFARGQMEVIERSAPVSGRATKSIYADGRGSVSVEVYLGEELVGEASVNMTDQEGVDAVKVLTIRMFPELGPVPASSTFQDGVLSIQFGTDESSSNVNVYQQHLRAVVSVRGDVDLDTISASPGGDVHFSGRGMGEAAIDYDAIINLVPF